MCSLFISCLACTLPSLHLVSVVFGTAIPTSLYIFGKCFSYLFYISVHHPDIICITESWLSADILNSEISIPGYVCFRGDRNRHGGGVIIYVSQLYNSRLLCSHAVLEIVTVVISNGNFKCCISLFYRPPHSLVSVDNIFQEYLESLDISRFSLFVLLGDRF